MPTYEYVCTSCGNNFDTVQSFSEPPLETCERCGGQIRRVFHPAGILFKGSGFYSTDNRRSGPSGKSSPGEKRSRSEKSGDSASPSSSSSDGPASSGPRTESRSERRSEASKTAEKSA